jgi:small GTP-binding protein
MPDSAMTPEQQQAYDEALKRIKICLSKRSTIWGKIKSRLQEDTRVTTLDLIGLGLTQLPPELCQLTALTSLNLSGNQLSSVPPELGKLTALTELHLWINQLSSVPPEFFHLKTLTMLDLGGNKLSSVPPELGQLTSLTSLNLGKNQLSSVPPELGQLTALTQLNLGGNQLSSVPPELGQLTALTQLNLSGNQLSSLPPELNQLTNLKELYLHGNSALGIPESILGPERIAVFSDTATPARPQDILDFYFSQRQAAAAGALQPLNEIKVMLVGRGGAGKTSLRRFFTGQAHNTDEKETPGIALDSFKLSSSQDAITVRLWDFAGQEITHALHQFFLTEGCVYILVLDPRSDTEMRDAEYWLGLLSRYGGGAPVLVALNKQDARQGGYDIDRLLLKERFPFIHSFTRTNCEKRDNCDDLRQRLSEAINLLKDTEPPKLQVPKSWLAVMNDCDGEAHTQKQCLTLDEFRGICGRHDVTEPAKQESLARLLHKLGAVLHFVDEPRLRDTAVLNPFWVTDGVYRLLRFKDKPGSDGTLTMEEGLQALPGETPETLRFFLRLMGRFEMCFPLNENEADGGELPVKWLIPGALNEFQPEGVTADWQAPGSVRLRYVYDPLPEGVIPRFIVMTHLLSEDRPRWRNGVVLQDGQAAALVRRGANSNHVEVTAFGPEAERLRLLEIIQGTLERIHADLPEPKPEAQLELAGLPGTFRTVADLEAAEQGGQSLALKTSQGDSLAVKPTPQLNQASEPQARDGSRQPLKTFLSYSHEDKAAKGIFQNNLTVMMKKNYIAPWHDGLIETGMLWREEIEENLARMDVFVGLLTTAFLVSDFIETVEIKAARDKLNKQGSDFLFVLILVDDIPLEGLDLAAYQILRPGGKAVCKHPSRKAGFNQAQKDLEPILLARQALKKQQNREDSRLQRHVNVSKMQQAEGITIIVQGDYIQGRKTMSDDNSIHIGGNVINSQVGQTLTNCTNTIQQQAPGEQKSLLEELQKQVTQLIKALPADKQDEAPQIVENLEMVVKEVTSAKPRRKWYSLSAEGLMEAATYVKDYGSNIAGALKSLENLVFP